jgi:hypothetical protein
MRTDKSATSRDQYFHIATRSKLGGNGKERKEEIGAGDRRKNSGVWNLRISICRFLQVLSFLERVIGLLDDFAFGDPQIRSTAAPEFGIQDSEFCF